jgi:hypothetical protein
METDMNLPNASVCSQIARSCAVPLALAAILLAAACNGAGSSSNNANAALDHCGNVANAMSVQTDDFLEFSTDPSVDVKIKAPKGADLEFVVIDATTNANTEVTKFAPPTLGDELVVDKALEWNGNANKPLPKQLKLAVRQLKTGKDISLITWRGEQGGKKVLFGLPIYTCAVCTRAREARGVAFATPVGIRLIER